LSQLAKRMRRRCFGDRPTDWQAYHAMVAEYLRPDGSVLDIGCGRGQANPFPWHEYPGVHLRGIDPDPRACENPYLTSFGLMEDLDEWPVEDASVDLAIARYVLEHVEKPESFFANLRRVLRPGGSFVFLCPNKYRPLSLLARVLPERALGFLDRARESDVFPTWHRANSARALRRLAREFDFETDRLTVREHHPPPWLDRFLAAFLLGLAYHRVVTLTRLDRLIGSSIHGVMRRR